MLFDKTASELFGLSTLLEKLPIRSFLGKKSLWNATWYGIERAEELKKEYSRQQCLIDYISSLEKETHSEKTKKAIRLFEHSKRHFEQTPDLWPILEQIEKGNYPLDEIQFFEIKNWIIPIEKTKQWCASTEVELEDFPDLNPVLKILDPDNDQIPSFYIYDSYDPELKVLRKRLKDISNEDKESINEIENQLSEIEYRVRKRLTDDCKKHLNQLKKALSLIVYWDILLAKSELAFFLNLKCPEIVENGVEYEGLFYPELKTQCIENNRKYQYIDIKLNADACLLTGANMSGKTVLIKSIALAQTLAQFGFFVPAKSAKISLFEDVCWIIGDEQNQSRGLSSFGAEIMALNNVLCKIRNKDKLLFLSDELARTTNPTEGRAIVRAFFDFWKKRRDEEGKDFGSCSLISTHYDSINNAHRRLRVKGLDAKRWMEECAKIDVKNGVCRLQEYMDYSIEEVNIDSPADTQAIMVAACLGVDPEFCSLCKNRQNEND